MPNKKMTMARALAGTIEWLEELLYQAEDGSNRVTIPTNVRDDIKSDLTAYRAAQQKGNQ